MIELREIECNAPGLLKIAIWRNQVLETLRTCHKTKVSMESQNIWVDDWHFQGDQYYFVYDLEGGEIVGYCGLDKINHTNRTAEVSLLIDPDKHGCGYGSEAVAELLGKAFLDLKLNCVFIEVYSTTSAWNFWKKCGFQFEGSLKARKYWKGHFYSSTVASIEYKDYAKLKTNERDLKKNRVSKEQLVDRLIEIGLSSDADSFMGKGKEETREIGCKIDDMGGHSFMIKCYEEVCETLCICPGKTIDLKFAWDGIGFWKT
jgi:RimJ/RimL family protein N-acetyltransferase